MQDEVIGPDKKIQTIFVGKNGVFLNKKTTMFNKV